MKFYGLLLTGIAVAVAAPVKLIVDTDMGGGGCHDVDDVAAVCTANALVDNGEAELLAVIQNSGPGRCSGAISVLNHYYGRDDVPIGAYKGTDLNSTVQPLDYVNNITDHYDSPIKDSSEVPDGTDVYRSVLAVQPDNSVMISSIGLMTNLRALLQSEADQYSPLNGYDLVKQKVNTLFAMAGGYPSKDAECNMSGGYRYKKDHIAGSAASGYVYSHMPPEVKIVFSGFEVGKEVQSGGRLSTCAGDDNPCRSAFIINQGYGIGRDSWDPLTTLVAVRGVQNNGVDYCSDCDGKNDVNGVTGANNWQLGSATNQTYLTLTDAGQAGNVLDDLLCQSPKMKNKGLKN